MVLKERDHIQQMIISQEIYHGRRGNNLHKNHICPHRKFNRSEPLHLSTLIIEGATIRLQNISFRQRIQVLLVGAQISNSSQNQIPRNGQIFFITTCLAKRNQHKIKTLKSIHLKYLLIAANYAKLIISLTNFFDRIATDRTIRFRLKHLICNGILPISPRRSKIQLVLELRRQPNEIQSAVDSSLTLFIKCTKQIYLRMTSPSIPLYSQRCYKKLLSFWKQIQSNILGLQLLIKMKVNIYRHRRSSTHF